MGTILRPAVPHIAWAIGWSSGLVLRKMRLTRLSITMLEMEQAGFISHREKLKHLGLDYEISERTQAPILEACPVVLDCQVDRIIEEDGICHIFAKIIDRLADPELLDDKGHFKNDRFSPTYFMGDGHQRVYRYLDNRVDPMGSFIKKARQKNDKS